jgi:hypothetical protein
MLLFVVHWLLTPKDYSVTSLALEKSWAAESYSWPGVLRRRGSVARPTAMLSRLTLKPTRELSLSLSWHSRAHSLVVVYLNNVKVGNRKVGSLKIPSAYNRHS